MRYDDLATKVTARLVEMITESDTGEVEMPCGLVLEDTLDFGDRSFDGQVSSGQAEPVAS